MIILTHPTIINLELFRDVQNVKLERSRGNNMEINKAMEIRLKQNLEVIMKHTLLIMSETSFL